MVNCFLECLNCRHEDSIEGFWVCNKNRADLLDLDFSKETTLDFLYITLDEYIDMCRNRFDEKYIYNNYEQILRLDDLGYAFNEYSTIYSFLDPFTFLTMAIDERNSEKIEKTKKLIEECSVSKKFLKITRNI